MNVSVIDGSQQMISAGIIGSVSTNELLSNINNKLKTYTNNITFNHMNDLINKGKQFFVKNIIEPYKHTQNKILNTLKSFNNKDNSYKALVTNEDFKKISPKMMETIILYKPVRDLFNEDRIYGFGVDKKVIPKTDRYRQLIRNGLVKNIEDKIDAKDKNENVKLRCVSVWKEDDPDISLEEIEMIEQTRIYIDSLLAKGIDPTDIENNIG